MNNFIEEFKQTSYYNKLINDVSNVLLIYISGSRLFRANDENSDYDIVIITLNGEHINWLNKEFIKYNNKKVHWYYCPLKDFFEMNYGPSFVSGMMGLKNLNNDYIIYENPQYIDVLNDFYSMKEQLSILAAYRYFEIDKVRIDSILNNQFIADKRIYKLCLASYYLTGEEPDINFLQNVKRNNISNETEQKIIDRIKIYQKHIQENPKDVEAELKELQANFYLGN